MNEPQLSAEMEKRLLDLLPLGLDDWLVEELKSFLATALEEQKEHEKTVIAQSNEWWNRKLATALEEQKDMFRSWITEGEMEMYTADGLADFLYKKLNGKNTNEK